jgi:hypothetical protein
LELKPVAAKPDISRVCLRPTNQLYAMKYGTPVVAHATGGLRDTVIDVAAMGEEVQANCRTHRPLSLNA